MRSGYLLLRRRASAAGAAATARSAAARAAAGLAGPTAAAVVPATRSAGAGPLVVVPAGVAPAGLLDLVFERARLIEVRSHLGQRHRSPLVRAGRRRARAHRAGRTHAAARGRSAGPGTRGGARGSD